MTKLHRILTNFRGRVLRLNSSAGAKSSCGSLKTALVASYRCYEDPYKISLSSNALLVKPLIALGYS